MSNFNQGETWLFTKDPKDPYPSKSRSMTIMTAADEDGFFVARHINKDGKATWVFVNQATYDSGHWTLEPLMPNGSADDPDRRLPRITRSQVSAGRVWLIKNLEADLEFTRTQANAIAVFLGVSEQYPGGWDAFVESIAPIVKEDPNAN